ncbi:MAG: hypothetical protein ACXV8Q_18275 [Methylobacter sp.]
MKKFLLPLLAAQALTFNAFAEEHKQHNEIYDISEVEDLAPPSNTTIISYQWSKDVHSSRKALKGTATTVSPLMTAHTNPIKVMAAVNTTLIFWGSSWNNSTFASDKIAGLNVWYNNLHNSHYINTVSEYTTLNHYLVNQKTDNLTTASNNPSSVLTEVCNLVGTTNIDPNGYYPVYTDVKRGTANYCAYHSAGTCGGKTVQFAFFFTLDNDPGCDPISPYAPPTGSFGSQQPGLVAGVSSTYQQSQGLAALANVSAHELMETVTDPAYFPPTGGGYWGGWYDSTGAENGDKCAWTFGPSNTGLSAGTVLIGGFDWKLQGEWSNKAQIGRSGYPTQGGQLKGCVTGS